MKDIQMICYQFYLPFLKEVISYTNKGVDIQLQNTKDRPCRPLKLLETLVMKPRNHIHS